MHLDTFLNKKLKIKNIEFKVMDLIIILLVTIIGLLLRYRMFTFESQDYLQNLTGWWKELADNGGFAGLKLQPGNYTQPYVYLLAIGTYLPWRDLTTIKLISVFCDLLLAVVIALCVKECTNSKIKSLFAYCFVFLAPTVVLNSAVWAQCDSVIMLFIALTIYCFLKEKPYIACAMLGLAMAIKIQSIFICPVLLMLWMNRKLSFKHLLIIPLVYCLSFIPTALAGGNYFDAVTFVYWQVTTTANALSFNLANMWAPIADLDNKILASGGTLLAMTVTFLSAYMCIRKPIKLTNKLLINMFLFFALLIPFMLPHMHDRYYYYAEIIAIIYAMNNTKRIYVPISIMFVSVFCYLPFLFEVTPIPLAYLSIIIIVMLFVIGKDLYNGLNENQIKD